MPDLVSFDPQADTLCVTVHGDVPLADLPALLVQVRAAVPGSTAARVRVDASRVNAADHACTVLLADVHALASAAGKGFELAAAPELLRRNLGRLIGDAAAATAMPAAGGADGAPGKATVGASAAGGALAALERPSAFGEFAHRVGDWSYGYVDEAMQIMSFTGELSAGLAKALIHPHRIRWRETLIYMNRCGNEALPIVILICFLMGLILGFQASVQLHVFGMDVYVADLVGMSIAKELGPLMVAMVSTGRAGSAFAAEIGTMKVSEEVDAMVTMGLDPQRFLIVPKVLALMAMMPILTLYGDLAGILGGLVVGVTKVQMPVVTYVNRTLEALSVGNIFEGLIKSLAFAIVISAVGCLRGLQTSGGAQGVGVSTTSAVVSGIFLIIVVDSMLTMMFSMIGFGV